MKMKDDIVIQIVPPPENGWLHMQNRVYDINGISPTITMWLEHGKYLIRQNMEKEKKQIELPAELKGKKFRIRKLTPRECFRLMGVDDADIDKMQAAGISNSGLYKLAGNSIVAGGNHTDSNGNVDGVLYNLFRKMFIETEPDETKDKSAQQLMLF